MKFSNTNCCAVQEISGLRMYKGPEEAMEAFCKANLDDGNPLAYKGYRCQPRTLFSFYLFTGSVGIQGKPRGNEWVDGKGFLPVDPDYGPKFAALILKNGLGSVIESPAIPNKAFHPDHANVVWIWAPDKDAIDKWWKTRKTNLHKGYVTNDKTGIAKGI